MRTVKIFTLSAQIPSVSAVRTSPYHEAVNPEDGLGKVGASPLRCVPNLHGHERSVKRAASGRRTHEGERMKTMMKLWKDEEGATAVEYGIMVALIAVGIIRAVTGVGQKLVALFNNVSSQL